MIEDQEAWPSTSPVSLQEDLKELGQKEKREHQIPRVKAILEIKRQSEKSRAMYAINFTIGIFLIFTSLWVKELSLLAGLFLGGTGLWFAKKENDYINYLKKTYGV